MKKIALALAAGTLLSASAHAQGVTLTMSTAQAGDPTDISAKNMAEVGAKKGLATIQVQQGKVLTKTLLEVAQGKSDISAGPFTLALLMSKGLGPYSGLGKEKGKAAAANLRLLYPYRIASFYLTAYASSGIDSWAKLKGKNVHNGPPRGGALITARQLISVASGGLKEKEGYNGRQVAWGQANAIFLDRSVDAAVRPGTNPAPHFAVLTGAGKMNLISVPKNIFESAAWKKLVGAPGRVSIIQPISDFAHYGDTVNVVSEDDMFRTVATVAGPIVHKKMDKKLVKALIAAHIESLPELLRNQPIAKNQGFGKVSNAEFGMCRAGLKYHPGAIEAWEEAGHKIDDCAKPKS